jgi:hypothetical protein
MSGYDTNGQEHFDNDFHSSIRAAYEGLEAKRKEYSWIGMGFDGWKYYWKEFYWQCVRDFQIPWVWLLELYKKSDVV